MITAIWINEACEAFTSTEFVRGSATAMTRACCSARSLSAPAPPLLGLPLSAAVIPAAPVVVVVGRPVGGGLSE